LLRQCHVLRSDYSSSAIFSSKLTSQISSHRNRHQ
jgi:hypothetical protein